MKTLPYYHDQAKVHLDTGQDDDDVDEIVIQSINSKSNNYVKLRYGKGEVMQHEQKHRKLELTKSKSARTVENEEKGKQTSRKSFEYQKK